MILEGFYGRPSILSVSLTMKWVLRFLCLNDGNNFGVITMAASKDVVMSIIREITGLTGQDIVDMKIITIGK